MDIIDIAIAKRYTDKSLQGLGALKGSPCKIKSIVPTYSTEDPTVVISNTITLEWDSNQTPGGSPILHEETFQTLDNGRGIYNVQQDVAASTAQYNRYVITFYDGTTDTFDIPVSAGQMKKQVVPSVPDPATADGNTIYLVPISTKPGSYQQFIRVVTADDHFEMLSIGSTDVDLTEYQQKIDDNIIKSYPNYDINTKSTYPTAKNVVGGINEHEKEIGATYDYANGKISNLHTYHNDTIISALNEIGNITQLEEYDPDTQTPATLVDAINLANKYYSLDKETTIDRTKNVDVLKLKRDAKDGSPIIQIGDNVEIPRVDIVERSLTEDNDFRTYDLKMAGNTSDPNDATNKVFGQVHIPKLKINKKLPTDTTTRIDTFDVEVGDTFITLIATPAEDAAGLPMVTSVKTAGGVAIPFTVNGKKVTFNSPITAAQAGEIKATYEVTTLAAQYYLDIKF